jgi:hypothetical protein
VFLNTLSLRANSFEGNGGFNRKFENLFLFRQGQLSVTKKLFNEAKIKAPRQRAQARNQWRFELMNSYIF